MRSNNHFTKQENELKYLTSLSLHVSNLLSFFLLQYAVQSVLALMCGADYQTVCSKSFKILAKLRGRNL
jgi:hypothetical protein